MDSHPKAESDPDYLKRYDRAACKAAEQIILNYSTSFSLASRLLGKRVREDISNLYAMVRIADEIVDGTAYQAGMEKSSVEAQLAAYETAVRAAPKQRFNTDPVLHAYGISARRCGYKDEYIEAFFASMRRDLHQVNYDPTSFDAYVYGSAEVIGLLCLQAFLVGESVSTQDRTTMEESAQALGAAFQKINFLRDLSEDSQTLGRCYFPELSTHSLDETTKLHLINDIRDDLTIARRAIALLPRSARAGVIAATNLFSELTDQLETVPAADIYRQRVRVPATTKSKIFSQAILQATVGDRSRKNRKKKDYDNE